MAIDKLCKKFCLSVFDNYLSYRYNIHLPKPLVADTSLLGKVYKWHGIWRIFQLNTYNKW